MSKARVRLGRRGEDIAANELARRGYSIVARNWRCETGEVDIVAERDGVTFFFEVRTRRGADYGTPEESVTEEKLERMNDVALIYLAEHDAGDIDWRTGLVAIEVNEAGRLQRLDIYDCLW
ncbi:MAG: YraN family protein [Anaerolineales bacterium]|nr:MAG: YraN family protein [Anaerolineales bacterium]